MSWVRAMSLKSELSHWKTQVDFLLRHMNKMQKRVAFFDEIAAIARLMFHWKVIESSFNMRNVSLVCVEMATSFDVRNLN